MFIILESPIFMAHATSLASTLAHINQCFTSFNSFAPLQMLVHYHMHLETFHHSSERQKIATTLMSKLLSLVDQMSSPSIHIYFHETCT